jgi:hypothetical protein
MSYSFHVYTAAIVQIVVKLDPDNGDSMFLRKYGIHIQNDRVPQTTGPITDVMFC